MYPEICQQIRVALDALTPSKLLVFDNSHLHIGHLGAKDGGGHFAVEIISSQFAGLNRIKRHRLVYQQVSALFKSGAIHALEVQAHTPDEINQKQA